MLTQLRANPESLGLRLHEVTAVPVLLRNHAVCILGVIPSMRYAIFDSTSSESDVVHDSSVYREGVSYGSCTTDCLPRCGRQKFGRFQDRKSFSPTWPTSHVGLLDLDTFLVLQAQVVRPKPLSYRFRDLLSADVQVVVESAIHHQTIIPRTLDRRHVCTITSICVWQSHGLIQLDVSYKK